MIVWDFPLMSNTISSEPSTASGTNTYTQSSIALRTGDTETNIIKCHNCKRMCYLFGFVAWSIRDATSYSLSDFPDRRTDGPFGFTCFVILGQGTVLSLHVSFTEIRQCCAVLLLWVTFRAELWTCFSYCRFNVFRFFLTGPPILYFIFISFHHIAQYLVMHLISTFQVDFSTLSSYNDYSFQMWLSGKVIFCFLICCFLFRK